MTIIKKIVRAKVQVNITVLHHALAPNTVILLSLSLLTLFFATSTSAQMPDGPAFVRDTHLIEDGQYTRPFQPAVHTSRDGRIALRLDGVVHFGLFTPEKLDEPFTVSEPGINNIYGADFRINQREFTRTEGVGAFRHIALCEAPPSRSNPMNPKACNGSDDCYDLTIIAATRPSTGNIRFVGIDVNVRVENPKTPEARIAEITHEEPVLGLTFPFKDFFETTTPADGRIIVGRTAGSTISWVDEQGNDRSGGIDSVYLVNDNPDAFESCDVRQFDKVYPLSYAPYDGTINNRYGFAMHPFRTPAGTTMSDTTNFGSYPWIDRDANNISVTTVRGRLFNGSDPIFPARCPEQVTSTYGSCLSDSQSDINSAALQGRIIMGLWTQGKSVVMDNLINNMDFGLGVTERRHRDVKLYNASSNHDGWVRVGGGRRGNGDGGPRPRGAGNANFLDSLEHRFNMFDNMKPVTASDVPWIISKGMVSDELIFDDYNNPDSFIVADMVPYYNRFSHRGIVNNATALPDRWSIPDYGRISNGRIERVANGGITGRGLWLNNDTSVEYRIPSNQRDINSTPWYVSIFFDRRFEGGRLESRNLITFSDGSSLRVRGDGGLQFLDTHGRIVKDMSINEPTQNRARDNDIGWAHVGLDIARGNREMRVYYNGFYLDRVDADEPIFRMAEGNLYVGANPANPNDGFRGWIDNFKVFAQGVNPEVACNYAKGTLIGTPEGSDWNQIARSYPSGHFRIRQMVRAAGEQTNEHYACYHDYRGDYRTHIANIPRNHRSIREAINFPEVPLHYGAPRPDSSNNTFCLSCHTSEGRLGMNTAALNLNSRLNVEDDPRRQPTQPDNKVSGFIPANWLGKGKPSSPIHTGRDGINVDQWLLAITPTHPDSGGNSSVTLRLAIDDTISRWNGSSFERFGPDRSRLVRIDAGENGEIWGINVAGNIYEWDGRRWQLRDSDGQDITVGGGEVYLTKTDDTIWQWNGSQFVRFGPSSERLERIDVGEDGMPWGINATGNIYNWTGRRWQHQESNGQDIGVGGGEVFLTKTDDTIWRWNGSKFVRFGPFRGRLFSIDAGSDGLPWGVNIRGVTYEWNGRSWVNRGDGAQEVGR